MNAALEAWNKAGEGDALDAMIACCGARRWASAMVALRPIGSVLELSEAADRVWSTMTESDWMEAFACHPRIGERKAAHATAKSTMWSSQEQSSVSIGMDGAMDEVLGELAAGNSRYEERFGFTYIVCATGKSGEEMLAILKRRLAGDREGELREAAEQQRQIMQIRLGKWLIE
ncbi:MAG TPA: 2-oxo-4-hydroxy-4-carboxy-5-ureidoimidazoline decarboxylase [Terracidiphilus sp.]|jgi:OHCU decarboxylase|nr:2-oxo-4-hydroxy-4-carboxy-5-ureidoimidazoline decarboxylase [Terracidiphilus sp.]